MHQGRPLGQCLHHFLLFFRGFHRYRFVMSFWCRQMQLICRLNVGYLLEHVHQFRQIEKFRKPCSCPIPGSFRGQLNRRYRFAEGRSPCVEVQQVMLTQGVILQIALHGVHFRHGIRDGSSRCEDNTTPARQLVHIAALHKHI